MYQGIVFYIIPNLIKIYMLGQETVNERYLKDEKQPVFIEVN